MRVSGKTIVVTGGGNGIGRELVLELLRRGARVAALDISEAGLAETAELAGASAERLSTHVADITDRALVESLPETVRTAHGNVDGLINCAGIIQPFVLFKDLEYSAIERIMNVNLWGTINMCKAFLPVLMGRPAAQIVNISSMGGYVPVPGQTMYGATKAAVKLLTEGLHSELAETNVKVTLAFPGSTATNIAANSGIAMAADAAQQAQASKIKMVTPQAAAKAILDGMERDDYHVFAGPDARFMDRFSRLSPRRAAALIYKQMRSLLPK